MISIKELHAGDGYRYLLRGVVADSDQMPGVAAVTAYYTEAGNPPGHWVGSGLVGLDRGHGLAVGTQVTEEQMERLYRSGADPVTGDQLGQAYRVPKSFDDRVAARVAALPAAMPASERNRMVEQIEAEERSRRVGRPVSGFDVTFSPPKSVSVMWALADHGVREQIYEAHREAVADVIATIEREVARTRIGTNGVAQVETAGVIAAAFDHWDSRAGDPQLHTHVVIANRVQGPDGKWRTLDSRGSLFPATVAMSELYDNLLADHVTARLGVGWRVRGQPAKSKNTAWELDAVSDDLVAAFSTRSSEIEREADRLIADYRKRHGRSPTDKVKLRLRQIATLATRPAKEIRTLSEMAHDWRDRAAAVVGQDALTWMRAAIESATAPSRRPPLLRVDDLAVSPQASRRSRRPSEPPELEKLAHAAFVELATERTTWKTWNIRAAAARAAMRHRMVTPDEREKLIAAVSARVAEMSVELTPSVTAFTPAVFTRSDGTSMFVRTHAGLFTSAEVLAAEERLLSAGRSTNAATVSSATVERVLAAPTADGYFLADDQADAVRDITASGRRLDILVGPAGAGKTTTLTALRAAWELDHGEGSLVGLAPSAAAADVLAESLGIATDNTAKWLHEAARLPDTRKEIAHLTEVLQLINADDPAWRKHLARSTEVTDRAADWAAFIGADKPQTWSVARGRGAMKKRLEKLRAEEQRWTFRPGQLVVIDEASLAGTLAVDDLVTRATHAGAKVLMVGDWAQLASVDAGGVFGMLVRDRGEGLAPELTGVRRFTHEWERTASVHLRLGDTSALDSYDAHGRLVGGTGEDMLDAAYRAWRGDEQAGLQSLLIAGDNTTVTDLNRRARADRVAAGEIDEDGVSLRDGTVAGVGDRIITRDNQRRLVAGKGWVKNGDTWHVKAVHGDGSLTVRRAKGRGTITLPARYVADNVELAYAVTAHRAQGATVDTAHALVTGATMMREILYVAMTRARSANTAYVVTDVDEEERHLRDADDPAPTARSVLTTVLRRQGAALSARETARAEAEKALSIGQLAAEYDTLHRAAVADRQAALLLSCGVQPAEAADSEHLVALAAAVHRADAHGLKPDTVLPKLAAAQPIPDDADPVRVLAARVARWTDHAMEAAPSVVRRQRRLIAGLVPAADGVTDPQMQRALTERETLLEERAATIARRAISERAPWLRSLGAEPVNDAEQARWRRCVEIVAAYRERHDITDTASPVGDPGYNWTQRHDYRQAASAVQAAQQAAGVLSESTAQQQAAQQSPQQHTGRDL
ncbi:MobF family relaxase [Jiangella sp. DSM 45060]|uniref:MobF family relaxase n=1 Tax=Jiangella sp. DSM 45060 TaxID=1798224 RepID=UPI00087A7F73|nr:MobF family relaxase [Jiangella sp. DSM 45060]SDT36502.1 conjugative relaxase domain-containing protein, TrwC/TraI family [Jiangella sp. DSM 45060]